MERDKGKQPKHPEAEKNRHIQALTRQVEKVAKRRGKPFNDGTSREETGRRFNGRGRSEEFTITDRRESISGRRFETGNLSISSWTQASMSWGVDSDYPFNHSSQKKVFEVRKDGKVVLRTVALMESNNGGPLSLTPPNPKHWIWGLHEYKPGPWENKLQRLATTPKRKPKAA